MSTKKERPNVKYEGPKITFKHYGSTYAVLTFLKMKRCPVYTKQISDCFMGYFRRPSDAERALIVLRDNGCAVKDEDNKWSITKTGLEVVFHVGRCRQESLFIRGFGL
jgi:hypothetical protein